LKVAERERGVSRRRRELFFKARHQTVLVFGAKNAWKKRNTRVSTPPALVNMVEICRIGRPDFGRLFAPSAPLGASFLRVKGSLEGNCGAVDGASFDERVCLDVPNFTQFGIA
jgi:hypothetical protein